MKEVLRVSVWGTIWVLSADIIPPAKPARRLSAHICFSHMLLVG